MARRLAHRGPDAAGLIATGPVVFAHRRLSVIAPGETGNQPMWDSTGHFLIIYNGEIYNYQEVRKNLEQTGAFFTTETDTEVILEAYKYWGIAFLEKLNGMFAFAIWDGVEQRVILARDRLGKKPLFYCISKDGSFSFASEVKALCEIPGLSRKLDYDALGHFLHLNYILSSHCIFSEIKKLPAAHVLLIARNNGPRSWQYWDLASSFKRPKRKGSLKDLDVELNDIIDSSVKLRLISDVPLGIFLSGGVDSATILASAVKVQPNRIYDTYTLGFREKSYSEAEEAKQTAALFSTNHHTSIVNAEDMFRLLEQLAYVYDEPFADTSVLPTYLLSSFARTGSTVCLTGDGGDEIFGGYETYAADRLYHWLRIIPQSILSFVWGVIYRNIRVSFDKVSLDYKLRRFIEGQKMNWPHAHFHWRTIFGDHGLEKVLNNDAKRLIESHPYDEYARIFDDVRGCHFLDQAMYTDIKTWLVDDILVKVDRASMAHALELRSPLLDYRLVEFAASLPVNLKVNFFKKKYLLKHSQRKRLPRVLLNRKKQGFNSPVSHWFEKGNECREITLSNNALSREIFKRSEVERLWNEHQQGQMDHGLKLLSLTMFELWCRSYNPAF